MTRPAGRERGFPKGGDERQWRSSIADRAEGETGPPLAHDFAKQSVVCLYLLARLTGEAGCGAFAPRLHRQENGRGVCERERTKSLSVFGERRQVYKPPSLVPRVETYIKLG